MQPSTQAQQDNSLCCGIIVQAINQDLQVSIEVVFVSLQGFLHPWYPIRVELNHRASIRLLCIWDFAGGSSQLLCGRYKRLGQTPSIRRKQGAPSHQL